MRTIWGFLALGVSLAMAQMPSQETSPVEVKVKSDNPRYAQFLVSANVDYYLGYGSDFGMGDNAWLKLDFLTGNFHGEARAYYSLYNFALMVESDDSLTAKPEGGNTDISFSLGASYAFSNKTAFVEGNWPFKSRHLGTVNNVQFYSVTTVKQPVKQQVTRAVRGGLYYLSHWVGANAAEGGYLFVNDPLALGGINSFDDWDIYDVPTGFIDRPMAYTRMSNTGAYIGIESVTRVGADIKIKPVNEETVYTSGAYYTGTWYADFILTPLQSYDPLFANGIQYTVAEGTGPGYFDPSQWGFRAGFDSQYGLGLGWCWGMEIYGQPGYGHYGYRISMGLGGAYRLWKEKPPKINDLSTQDKKLKDMDEFRKMDSDQESEPAESKNDEDDQEISDSEDEQDSEIDPDEAI